MYTERMTLMEIYTENTQRAFCQKMGILPGDIVLLSVEDEYDAEEEFDETLIEERTGGMDGR